MAAGVDRRGFALLLSFIVGELWYGCFLLPRSFVFPKKIVPFVSRSPHEAEIGPVFLLYPAVLFLVVLVVERAARARGAAEGDDIPADPCGERREAGVRTLCADLRSGNAIAGHPGAQRVWTAAERAAIPAGKLFGGRAGGLLHRGDGAGRVARCNADCGQRACGCES